MPKIALLQHVSASVIDFQNIAHHKCDSLHDKIVFKNSSRPCQDPEGGQEDWEEVEDLGGRL